MERAEKNHRRVKLPLPVHDPRWVLRRSRALARVSGMRESVLARVGEDPVVAYVPKLAPRADQPRVIISAGVHGDEPAGPAGLLDWWASAEKWWQRGHIILLPCLNPWGLRQNVRMNQNGLDLNRGYRREDEAVLRAQKKFWAETGPFDLALMLHEDYDAPGFYLYELARSRESWGAEITRAVAQVCAVDARSKIEGARARGGVIRRRLQMAWFEENGMPEAVEIFLRHAPRVYTFETPSEGALPVRIAAQRQALEKSFQLLFSQ